MRLLVLLAFMVMTCQAQVVPTFLAAGQQARGSGGSGPSFVQCQSNESTTATATTVTITTSSTHLIYVFTSEHANQTSSVVITDSASQSWTGTQVGSYVGDPGGASFRSSVWVFPNSATLTTVTATWSGSLSTNVDATVCEVSNAPPSSAVDSSATGTASGNVTSLTSGSLTTTNANDILFYSVTTQNGGRLLLHRQGSQHHPVQVRRVREPFTRL